MKTPKGLSSWCFFTNPFEKYARQNGFIFPNFRGEHKKHVSYHHPAYHLIGEFPFFFQAKNICIFGGLWESDAINQDVTKGASNPKILPICHQIA